MNGKANPARGRKPKLMETQQATSPSCSMENTLAGLLRTSVLKDFVRENNGSWDHRKWLELCDEISREGYSPIDFDQVGLALEREKTDYLAGK